MKLSTFTYNQKAIPWGLFLSSCIFYLLNLNFSSSGDTIYYANIIDSLSFEHLTTHQGYYLLGFIVKELLGLFFTLSTDQVLAVMNALFGAGSIVVGYSLLKLYLGSQREALIGTLMLFLCHRFYDNSTSAEIYIVQTFLIWSSYLLFEKQRFYLAGIFIGLALWVSPLTVFFGLWFLVVAYIRGFGIIPIIKLSIPVALIYVPFLFFYYEELLWGNRGLITADGRRQLDIVVGAKHFLAYQFKHYTFINLLALPALFALKQEKKLLWIFLAVAIPNIYVISNLRIEDNVFILALDVFFVCWYVIGWRVLRERSLTWIAVVLLFAHITVFLATEHPFLRDSHTNYSDEMKNIATIVKQAENPVLFADWDRRMSLVYFNREQATYPLEQGYWHDLVFDMGHLSKNTKISTRYTPDDFVQYKSIFVLETWQPSPHTKLFLSEDNIQQRYEESSIKRKLERFLNIKCQPVRNGMFTLYRCR